MSQAEVSIVQCLYRALKKAPVTHKLGSLYVVDSVVRQWIEKAKAAGQELQFDGRGEPGTYSAAVKRVTELMPALFDDTIKGLPADQKPKLENMVAIWERGNTFPLKLLQDFKSKLNSIPKLNGAPSQQTAAPNVNGAATQMTASSSTSSGEKYVAPRPSRPLLTPIGFPPGHVYDHGFLPGRFKPGQTNGAPNPATQPSFDPRRPQPPQPPQLPPSQPTTQDTAQAEIHGILAALAKAGVATAPATTLAPGNPITCPPPPQVGQVPPNIAELLGQAGPSVPQPLPQMAQPSPYGYSAPSSAPPMAIPAYQPPQQTMYWPQAPYAPQPPPSIPPQYAVAPPPPPQASQSDPLGPLRGILPENILNDHDKLVPALKLLQDLQKDGIAPEKWGPVLEAFQQQYQPQPHAFGDRNRGRSRSPERNGSGGRASPVYGTYDDHAAKQGDGGRDVRNGGSGGRGRYRQRSPMRSGLGQPTNGRPMQPKNIGYDESLPRDNIKVLSRTLFVGGANGTQQEIQEVFERFGRVQTCIANRDKRHAFVKMTTRDYALAAKQGMEELQNRNDREVMSVARQTKWGVGFGPRECCDYLRGESIIPINKLTEADNKWLHTAEYGGTGGKPLEGGMVLEEPDIEIGAGVSSKVCDAPFVMPSNRITVY